MENMQAGKIFGRVSDMEGACAPIVSAKVSIHVELTYPTTRDLGQEEQKNEEESRKQDPGSYQRQPKFVCFTDSEGKYEQECDPGSYIVTCEAFVRVDPQKVDVEPGCSREVSFKIPLGFQVNPYITKEDCGPDVRCDVITAGRVVKWKAEHCKNLIKPVRYDWTPPSQGFFIETGVQLNTPEVHLNTNNLIGRITVTGRISEVGSAHSSVSSFATVMPQPVQSIGGNVAVTMRRTATHPTADQALWVAIRNRTKAISFSGSGYKDFIDRVLCQPVSPQDPALTNPVLKRKLNELGSHAYGVGAYDLLKTATETFLLLECGVAIKDDELFKPEEEASRLGETVSLGEIQDRLTAYLGEGKLPYIKRILKAVFPGEPLVDRVYCYGVLRSRVEAPCLLELIWSYWHEEGMLAQTLNAISLRFQNRRGAAGRDPLAHIEIDPLRPLNNLLWGYIQDEYNRLTVQRRAYEYDHHYGLTLYGKAVPELRPADSRSKFLEAFHNLLRLSSIFFTQDDDTTVIADGFPVLNALKEVHLLLAQGAHNQFGDLPWTARVEMLTQEWLLARPEMRDFLQSRAMVPYKEDWMAQVDTMKKLQGWTDVTVTHFRDLGVFGEQILLSIRYGDWIDVTDQESAKNWARYWRPEIQGYIHAYRAVTGVDLTNPDTVDYTIPAVHLRKRLAMQQRNAVR